MPAAALSGDAATVARLSFTDGCIGETFAAALARRAQRHATDPAVARVLARRGELGRVDLAIDQTAP